MPYSTLIFDLDDTLYPSSCGLWNVIRSRIDLYMHDRLNMVWEEIPTLRHELFMTYGTTMRGLQTVYHISEQDYLAFVHDVPLQDYLTPNPAVRSAISSLTQRKVIFTNADRNHARRVLDRLQLSDCFEQVIDILDISPYCKPMPEGFQTALKMLGSPSPADCIFIDDTLHNIVAARSLGFYTVQVHPHPSHPHGDHSVGTAADAMIDSIEFLNRVPALHSERIQ
jgi:putative hydrolase of the HAD superfamily